MKTGDKVIYMLEGIIGLTTAKLEFVGVISQCTKTHARITIPSREGAYIVLPISEISLCN